MATAPITNSCGDRFSTTRTTSGAASRVAKTETAIGEPSETVADSIPGIPVASVPISSTAAKAAGTSQSRPWSGPPWDVRLKSQTAATRTLATHSTAQATAPTGSSRPHTPAHNADEELVFSPAHNGPLANHCSGTSVMAATAAALAQSQVRADGPLHSRHRRYARATTANGTAV